MGRGILLWLLGVPLPIILLCNFRTIVLRWAVTNGGTSWSTKWADHRRRWREPHRIFFSHADYHGVAMVWRECIALWSGGRNKVVVFLASWSARLWFRNSWTSASLSLATKEIRMSNVSKTGIDDINNATNPNTFRALDGKQGPDKRCGCQGLYFDADGEPL